MTLTAPEPGAISSVEHGPYMDGRRASRQIYRDGALFIAEHEALPEGFWHRHPLVHSVAADSSQSASYATRVWPIHYEIADGPDLPTSLGREPEVLIHGWLNPGQGFWAVHPDVEALDYFWSMGGEGYPDAWQARIWLKGT